MRYATVCSGIEAPSVAWAPLGWRPAFFSEIEPFPKAVLAHRHPGVPDRGDMNLYKGWPDEKIDLLCAGTPCQAFSVAGLRRGLADPRGNLTLVFLGIVERLHPRWVVWENVPGILSEKTGAFNSLLRGFDALGYHVAWRMLDAQYFGVPQRRRRIFLVGHSTDWKRPVQVLFDGESLRGHLAPGEKPGQDASADASGRAGAGSHSFLIPGVAGCLQERDAKGSDSDTKPGHLVIAFKPGQGRKAWTDGIGTMSPTLSSQSGGNSSPAVAYTIQSVNTTRNRKQNGIGISNGKISYTCTARDQHAIVYENHGQDCRIKEVSVSPQLNAKAGTGGNNLPLAMENAAVRRLTPVECERLQGFPDDYTKIPYRGRSAEACPVCPRYRALGNSMAVPVLQWIGEGIERFDR